jgi:sugar lactone lactonase YvrE/subtilisin-like proprotein convertase family protein
VWVACSAEPSSEAPGELATKTVALSADGLSLVSPTEKQEFSWAPAGVQVTVDVDVVGFAVGPTAYKVQILLDGAPVPPDLTDPLLPPVQVLVGGTGFHYLYARLVDPAGQPLPTSGSRAGRHLKLVNRPCSGDLDCDDGNACSNENCFGNECSYGLVDELCCVDHLECMLNPALPGNDYHGWCVAHACTECLNATECDDGNLCTTDTCGPEGSCSHQNILECCPNPNLKSPCDDANYCTVDTCDGASHLCQHADNGDPLCCNTDIECQQADPCVAYMCYKVNSAVGGQARCRYGPSQAGCCTLATAATKCNDGNLCTTDGCVVDVGQIAGTCVHVAVGGGCCTTAGDCDDSNPATLNTCVDFQCSYPPDPGYCALPATSMLVLHEVMASPAPELGDAKGEWVELLNPGKTVVSLKDWKLKVAGKSHLIAESIKVYPGQLVTLARVKEKADNGGFTPAYAYGNGLPLPDPFEVGGPVAASLELYDAAGLLVDKMPLDSTLMSFEQGRSFELKNPYLDHALPTSWAASGHTLDPVLDQQYGDFAQYGSPNHHNLSAYQPLAYPGCALPPQAPLCALGACGLDSHCTWVLPDGCCGSNPDCDDFNPCTPDLCNLTTFSCQPSPPDAACCTTQAQCDDQNPCNLDRCMAKTCRHSDYVVPDCCIADTDCNDQDDCTLDLCDLQTNACVHHAVVPGSGLTCCNGPGDCSDQDACTVDHCNATSNTCVYVANKECCSLATDPCDDDNPCTVDSCDVVLGWCAHSGVAGCCDANADCPSDGVACTADGCDMATHTCVHPAIPGCCQSPLDCNDGLVCTEDLCSTSNQCHHLEKPGCCTTNASCDDGAACTADSCTVEHACSHAQAAGCCTPGASSDLLVGPCGALLPASCTYWQCSQAGQCVLSTKTANCCSTHPECDDGAPCTNDFCIGGLCKHNPILLQGCCGTDTDCPDDGNPCTLSKCVNQLCQAFELQGCVPGVVPPLDLGPDGVGHGFTGAGCWLLDHTGYLGPDAHHECFGFVDPAPVGGPAVLVSPGFNPTGHKAVTVQLRRGWTSSGLGGCANDGNGVCGGVFAQAGDLALTEVVASPAASAFVEAVNTGGRELLLDGLALFSDNTLVGSLPNGICLAPGQALVVYGAVPVAPTGCERRVALGTALGLVPGGGTVKLLKGSVGPSFTYPAGTLGGTPGLCANGNQQPYCQNGAGVHALEILWSADPTSFGAGSQVKATPLMAGSEDPGTLMHAELPPLALVQPKVHLGFRVPSSNPPGVDLALDDIRVAAGRAPFFVTEKSLASSYSPSQAVSSLGAWHSPLGETNVFRVWAYDPDFGETAGLKFELVGAPDFLSVIKTENLWAYGLQELELAASPLAQDALSSFPIKVRVSDGIFTAELAVELVTVLDGGYVVWAPPGTAPEDGAAWMGTLAGLGVVSTLVEDLAEVPDWNQVKGLVVTLGGASSAVPLDAASELVLQTYLEDGGRLVLEGSKVFGDDPSAGLQGRLGVVTNGKNAGPVGPLAGRYFLYPDPYTYLDQPAYAADIDGLAAALGCNADARVVLRKGTAGVGVARDDGETGARTYAQSILLRHVANPGVLAGRVLGFLNGGFGSCLKHEECDDGLACTKDQCIGESCVSIPQSGAQSGACPAGSCLDDKGCPEGEVCRADGACIVPPGTLLTAPIAPKTFACDSTDAVLKVTQKLSGFEVLTDLYTSVWVTSKQGSVGALRARLSHDGVTVGVGVLLLDGLTSCPWLAATWDIGRVPELGSMSDFDGQFVGGLWTLELTYLGPPGNCLELEKWDLRGIWGPAPSCANDAVCKNVQVCDGDETCNLVTGTCQEGTAPTCSDGNPCTADLCDPVANAATGACLVGDPAPTTCSPAACSGAHALDAGDGTCALPDACVGGLSGGIGTCTEVCPTCIARYAPDLDLPIPDAGCATASFLVSSPDPLVENVYLKLDVVHPELSHLSIRVVAPDGTSETVISGQGLGLANFQSTFPLSNPNTVGKLCALQGGNPDGLWQVVVCDALAGQAGTLRGASLFVKTTADPSASGQNCASAIPVPSAPGTYDFTGSTECKSNATYGGCTGVNGHDVVYAVNPLAWSWIHAVLVPAGWDGGLYLTDACSPPGSTLCSDAPGAGVAETIDLQVPAGTHYVVVDAMLASAWGAYTLSIGIQGIKADGETCLGNFECAAGHCANGFCCSAGDCCAATPNCPASYTAAPVCDVSATCQGHQLVPGCSSFVCTSSSLGDDSACGATTLANGCGLYKDLYCTGAVAQVAPVCPASCTVDADCDTVAYCNASSVCVLKNPNGVPCTRVGECQSNQCTDGVCCSASCGELCKSCVLTGSVGTCSFVSGGQDPGEECAGVGFCGGTCNGGGACQWPASTVACGVCTRCDGAGSCSSLVAAGSDPDNTCALCSACNGAGACQGVGAGQDPVGDCPVDAVTACNRDGVCNGAGACRLYGSGTVCVDQGCAAVGYVDPNHTCDGLGTCNNPADLFCQGYVCSNNACLTSCLNNGDCITGYTCYQQACVLGLPKGAPCTTGPACSSGFCNDGFCCESNCGGACQACGVAGQEGTCVKHPSGTDPEAGCGGYYCDGTGVCDATCGGHGACKTAYWCDGVPEPPPATEGAYASAVEASLPVAWWRLGDPSGSTTAAAATGWVGLTYGAGPTLAAPGGLATSTHTAVGFNLTGANLGQHAKAQPMTSWPATALTVELWVKGTVGAGGIGGTFLSYGVSSDNGFAEVVIGTQPTLAVTVAGSTLVTTKDPLDGAWHHLVVSWKSTSGAVEVFLDGARAASGTLALGSLLRPNGALVLGQKQGCLGACFDTNFDLVGHLDEVAIYDRALRHDEVVGHHAAGKFGGPFKIELLAQGLTQPLGLAVDAANFIYVGEGGTNDRIVKIDPGTGAITPYAAPTADPVALAFGSPLFGGDLYVASSPASANLEILRVSNLNQSVTSFYVSAMATEAQPRGVAIDVSGAYGNWLWAAEALGADSFVLVEASGARFGALGPLQLGADVTDVAFGRGDPGFGTDLFELTAALGGGVSGLVRRPPAGAPSTLVQGSAALGDPVGLAFAPGAGGGGCFSGYAYLSDATGGRLLQVAPTGGVTTLAQGFDLTPYPVGGALAISAGGTKLYLVETGRGAVWRVSPLPGEPPLDLDGDGHPNYCDPDFNGDGQPNLGLCQPKRPKAGPCTQDVTCQVGLTCSLQDQVCCTSACGSRCKSCNLAASPGDCLDYTAGLDPQAECAAYTNPPSCGQTGACNGGGACQLYASGTGCGPGSCTNGTSDPADTCDGAGLCVDPPDVFCGGHVCVGSACGTDCLGNPANCLPGFTCSGTQCQPTGIGGSPCTIAQQCISGICADGVCCDRQCDGPCRQCNKAGSVGTCVDHAVNTDPEAGCLTYTCNGQGACKTSCELSVECSPGNFCDDPTPPPVPAALLYERMVKADRPTYYWRMGDAPMNCTLPRKDRVIKDSMGNGDFEPHLCSQFWYPGPYSGPDLGIPGAILGSPDTAAKYGPDNYKSSRAYLDNFPDVAVSFEMWLKDLPMTWRNQLEVWPDWWAGPGYWDQVKIETRGAEGPGITAGGCYASLPAGTFPNDGAWHHLVFTYDSATGFCEAFYDGRRMASASSKVGRTFAANTMFEINNSGDGMGKLDELAIYDHVLTNESVLRHFLAGKYGFPFTVDQVASGLGTPYAAAVDATGYVYVGEDANDRILRVDPATGAKAVYGTGTPTPLKLVFQPSGSPFPGGLYVSDGNGAVTNDFRVLRVPPGGGPAVVFYGGTAGEALGASLAIPPGGTYGDQMFGTDALGSASPDTLVRIAINGTRAGAFNAAPFAQNLTALAFGQVGALGAGLYSATDNLEGGTASLVRIAADLTTTTTLASGALLGRPSDLALPPFLGGCFGADAYLTDATGGRILRVQAGGSVAPMFSGVSITTPYVGGGLAFDALATQLYLVVDSSGELWRVRPHRASDPWLQGALTPDLDLDQSPDYCDVDFNGDQVVDPAPKCVALRPNGQPCKGAEHCLSGICSTDGICCNAACSGVCSTCVGGTCSSVGAGLDPLNACPDHAQGCAGSCNGAGACQAACSGYTCTAGACGTSCVGDPGCQPGFYCAGTVCQPKGALGAGCTATNQCLSGMCEDFVCCDGLCGGACRACNLAGKEGTCVEHTNGTDPEAGCGTLTCDGLGSCSVACNLDLACASTHYCAGPWPVPPDLSDLYATTVRADKPVAYWRLNESAGATVAVDELGGHPLTFSPVGTLQGNVQSLDYSEPGAFPSSTRGKRYAAVCDYTVTPAITQWLAETPTFWGWPETAISIEFWAKHDDVVDNPGCNPWGSYWDWSGCDGFPVSYEANRTARISTGFAIRPHNQDAVALVHPRRQWAYYSASPPHGTSAPDGAWHHYVAVFQPAGMHDRLNSKVQYATGVIYMDGQVLGQDGGIQGVGLTEADGGRLRLGNCHTGSLDEVAIYPYELRSSQVARHYAAARLPSVFQLSPLAEVGGYPLGIATHSDGTLYVANSYTDTIEKFDPVTGNLFFWTGVSNTPPFNLAEPVALAFSADETVLYVAAAIGTVNTATGATGPAGPTRLYKVSLPGWVFTIVYEASPGPTSFGPQTFPAGLLVDAPAGELLVTDPNHPAGALDQILRFSLAQAPPWTPLGSFPPQLAGNLVDITRGRGGVLGTDRYELTSDRTAGVAGITRRYLDGSTEVLATGAALGHPHQVVAGPPGTCFSDRLYVSEGLKNSVLAVDPRGVVSPVVEGLDFYTPAASGSMDFSPNGSALYITEDNSRRISKLTPLPGSDLDADGSPDYCDRDPNGDGVADVGICTPKVGNGSLCTRDSHCVSGFCAPEGVCCTSACKGFCEGCAGGTCAAYTAGTDPMEECPGAGACGPTCNGAGACQAPTCSCPASPCLAGWWCQAGSCVATKALGTVCMADGECQSGSCADGVCCTSMCAGVCQSCNLPGAVGTCTDHPAGTDPGGECGSYTCKGSGGCATSCGVLQRCALGHACTAGAAPPFNPDAIYRAAVMADSPRHYWRVGEAAGPTMVDEMGILNLTSLPSTTFSQPGAIAEAHPSVYIPGQSPPAGPPSGEGPGLKGIADAGFPITTLSVELWWKSGQPGPLQGGRLFSYGGWDQFEMLLPPTCDTCTHVTVPLAVNWWKAGYTPINFRDGQWHHLVSSWNGATGQLKTYVDGTVAYIPNDLVPASLAPNKAFVFGNTVDASGNVPNSGDGAVGWYDELAIYAGILTEDQVLDHYHAGRDRNIFKIRQVTPPFGPNAFPHETHSLFADGTYLYVGDQKGSYGNYQSQVTRVDLATLATAKLCTAIGANGLAMPPAGGGFNPGLYIANGEFSRFAHSLISVWRADPALLNQTSTNFYTTPTMPYPTEEYWKERYAVDLAFSRDLRYGGIWQLFVGYTHDNRAPDTVVRVGVGATGTRLGTFAAGFPQNLVALEVGPQGTAWDTYLYELSSIAATGDPASSALVRRLDDAAYTPQVVIQGAALGRPLDLAFAPRNSCFGTSAYISDLQGGRLLQVTPLGAVHDAWDGYRFRYPISDGSLAFTPTGHRLYVFEVPVDADTCPVGYSTCEPAAHHGRVIELAPRGGGVDTDSDGNPDWCDPDANGDLVPETGACL